MQRSSERYGEIVEFSRHMAMLPHRYKIFVPGNHDVLFEKDLKRCKELLGSGVTVLLDEMVTIEGLKIYGSPWTPRFCDWAFNLDRGELGDKWKWIPDDLDVLITHGPPQGILDADEIGKECGCGELLAELPRIKPKLHVFGHLHHGYGVLQRGGTTFVNACICNDDDKPVNKPLVAIADGKEIHLIKE